MKRFKKILAMVIAMAMVLGMTSMAAFAADGDPTGSITIKSNETVNVQGKTFNAYKILDATYADITTTDSETGDETTSRSIAYTVPSQMRSFYNNYFTDNGDDVTTQAATAGKTFDLVVTDKIAELTNASDMQAFVTAALNAINAMSATDKAALLGGSSTVASGTDVASTTISPLEAGYYIVEDAGSATPISSIMLDTVTDADVEIIIKANTPGPDKQIISTDENGDVTTDANGNITSLSESNNVGVGSTVNYQITQTVPNYTGYDHYYFILNDALSEGLTFNNDVVVWVDVNGDGKFEETLSPSYKFTRNNTDNTTSEFTYTSEKLTAGTDYYLYTQTTTPKADTGLTFQVAFADVMKFPVDAKIKVTYSANVNSDAITGIDPNTNEAKLQYSNNPSKSEDQKDDTDKPGTPANTTDHPLGTSPSDWTVTYTTELDITKVDEEGNPLEGVQFTLTGTSAQVVVKGQVTYEEDPNGTYYLLKDGTYTTTAPTTQSSMTKAAAGATSGYVKATAAEIASTTIDKSQWVTINETAEGSSTAAPVQYRPYVAGESGDVYILNLANDSDYVSTVVKYKQVAAASAAAGQDVKVTMVGETDEDGELNFTQLGAGTYTLSETKVPAGYNKAEDITFTIGWTAPTADPITETSTCTWTKAANDNNKNDTAITLVTSGDNEGTFTVQIENKKGVELPSTGGIGTTIFYVVGAILVIGAGVIMITRRRMDA